MDMGGKKEGKGIPRPHVGLLVIRKICSSIYVHADEVHDKNYTLNSSNHPMSATVIQR